MLDYEPRPKAAEPEPPARAARPLDPALRREAEARLGYDFARVRVARDAGSSEAAEAIGARAFTIGERIALHSAAPEPTSPDGRALALHELAHVAQAYDRLVPAGVTPRPNASGDWFERDAAARLATTPVEPARPAPSLGASALALRDDGKPTPDAGVPAAPVGKTPPPAPAPAAGAVSQKLYDAAVALIASRSKELFDVLKVGKVGTPVPLPPVHLEDKAGTNVTSLDVDFTLEIVNGGVPAGALAAFENVPPTDLSRGTASKLAVRLPIHVQAPATTSNPELALSEYLFHEGIHLLLARDRLLEGIAPTSSFLAARATYGKSARSSPSWSALLRGAEAVLVAKAPKGRVPKPAQAAEDAIDSVIDERFALDRQRQLYPGIPVDNALIASAYLAHELVGQGAAGPDTVLAKDPAVVALIAKMTDVLNAIPFATTSTGASVGKVPAPTQPTPAPKPKPNPKP